MSNLKIKKAVKLLVLLLIINLLLLLSFSSYSQTDTAKLRKELYALLKKYGLKDASFLLKVESLNQKGGQTAFEINNNYKISGDLNVYANVFRQPEKKDVEAIIYLLQNKNRKIILLYLTPDYESKFYCTQLQTILINNGYKDVEIRNRMLVGYKSLPNPITVDTVNYTIQVELNGR